MEMLLEKTFELIIDDGSKMNRSQWLDYIKSTANDYEQLSNGALAVRIYGNVAVATGTYQNKARVNGRDVVHNGRFTDVWIEQKGEWKCVASQGTLVSR